MVTYPSRCTGYLRYLISVGLLLTGMAAYAHFASFEHFGVNFKVEAPKTVDVMCVNCGQHVLKQAAVFSCLQHESRESSSDEDESMAGALASPADPAYYTYTGSRLPVCAVCHDQLLKLDAVVVKEITRIKENQNSEEASKTADSIKPPPDKKTVAFKLPDDSEVTAEPPKQSKDQAQPAASQQDQPEVSGYDHDVCKLAGPLQVIMSHLHIATDSQGRPTDAFSDKLVVDAEQLTEYSPCCQMCSESIPLDHTLKQHSEKHRLKCGQCHRVLISEGTDSSAHQTKLEDHQGSGCPVPCRYCKTEFPRKELQEHLVTCEQRMTTCLKCSDQLNGSQLFEHYMGHDIEPVTCTSCESQVISSLYPCHVSQHCPPAVACPSCFEQCGMEWMSHIQTNHPDDFRQLCYRSDFDCPSQKRVAAFITSCAKGTILSHDRQGRPVQVTDHSVPAASATGSMVDSDPLSAMDFRISLLENAFYGGSFIWKIPELSKRYADATSGKYISIFSLPFYTSRDGYKLCLRMYLGGDGMGKGQYLSLFLVIMKGEYDDLIQWPFAGHKVTLAILDQSGAGDHIINSFAPDVSSSSFRQPKADMNIASGFPRMAHHHLIFGKGDKPKPTQYTKNDTLFVQVIIDTSKIPVTGVKVQQ